MLRINLLRHLDLPEVEIPPEKEPHGAAVAAKRLLALLLLIGIVAGAVWLARHPEWRPRLHAIARPEAPEPPAPIAVDTARLRLEARAADEIAALQAEAARLSLALEAFLPAESASRALPAAARPARAVLTPGEGFVLRGEAASPAALDRLRDSLARVPGVGGLRVEERAAAGARGRIEFIVSGAIAPDSAETPAVPAAGIPERGALDRAWAAFLEEAAAAGVEFTVLPAGASTASGSLRATPYRVTAKCPPRVLREFLEGMRASGSPFGIRRIAWETTTETPAVSLDIMAFSRR